MSITPIRRAPSWRRNVGAPEDLGPVADHLDRYTIHLRANHRSKATIYRYTLAATQLSSYLRDPDVGAITRADIEKFVAHSLETRAGSTAAGRHVALAQFFKWLQLECPGFASPMAGMVAPGFESPMIAVAPTELLVGLIAQAERGTRYEDLRDAALLRLFVDTGARLSEITLLRLEDVLEPDRLLLTGKSKGKGPVPRQVRIGHKAERALRKYLRARREHPCHASERVWLGLRGPMTPSGVRQMVWKRSAAAGQRIHPHVFRHTFAHGWKSEEGRHDGDLMTIMGWRTETMLHRYGRSAAQERALEAQRRHGAPGDRI